MAECTALACPRLRNTDPDNRTMNVAVPSSAITKDQMGHTWCNYCQKQRKLMDYGKEHKWPEVHADGAQGRYAILGGAEDWYVSIACGNQDSIDAFYRELIGDEQVAQKNNNSMHASVNDSSVKKREKLLMEF